MAKFQRILHNPNRLKAMTGLNQDQFRKLLPHFAHALEQRMEHQTIDGYLRYGRRYTSYRTSPLPTAEDKLLFILTYLKINPIQEIQGQLFEMSRTNVSKWFHLLHDILNLALAQQHCLPARNAQELAQFLQNIDHGADELLQFFHDGTERPIRRPKNHDDQKFYYSGKSKQHAVKNVLVVNKSGNVLYLSDTYEGKAHDKRIADESGYSLPEESILFQDTGFQGFNLDDVTIMQPKKKPKGGTLTSEEKTENRRIASIRVHIEHVIGDIKRFAIVREVIRFWCDIIRDKVIETCCGLHNFLLSVDKLSIAHP